MPTVVAMIERMFPRGTNPTADGVGDRLGVPRWPPDAFAAAAALVGRSGCYSRPEFTGLDGSAFDDPFVEQAVRLGRQWAGRLDAGSDRSRRPVDPDEEPELFRELQALWDVLLKTGDRPVSDAAGDSWCRAAITLMVVADEACRGVGFASPALAPGEITRLMALVHLANLEGLDEGPPDREGERFALPHVPRSLCLMVPPDEACVHPKTRAPRAGFTLRSLSHYLALVPPIGEVEASWRNLNEGFQAGNAPGSPIDVLLVPFPYHIPDGCFRVCGPTLRNAAAGGGEGRDFRSYFFDAEAGWLRHEGRAIDADDLADFLIGLIRQAEAAGGAGRCDVLVMPELSLEASLAGEVAARLARTTSLNLFICGVFQQPPPGGPINAVETHILFDGEVLDVRRQVKHHRWKIDAAQARSYRLGPAFDDLGAEAAFWEHIDITRREASFWVFRSGVSVATLVCEDLARVDPIHGYIRSIGPSLVIALLMDAAQKKFRWPGRYAISLNDDPGSSVLTLTSLGMIRRAVDHYEAEAPQAVAFWAGAGRSRELTLDPGCHAILLRLEPEYSRNYTLDGRSDGGRTITLNLPTPDEEAAGPAERRVFQVRHPSPPAWLGLAESAPSPAEARS